MAAKDQLVFISYSRMQFYFAESLVTQLQFIRLIPVWFDIQQLAPGENWQTEIKGGLQRCTGLVLIASRAALSSAYVRAEWEAALAAGKPVYIVLFEEVHLPVALEQAASIIDLRRDFDVGIKRLIDCIHQGHCDRDPVPSPARLGLPRRVARPVATIARTLAWFAFILIAYAGFLIGSGLRVHAILILALSAVVLWFRLRFLRRQISYRPLMIFIGIFSAMPLFPLALFFLIPPDRGTQIIESLVIMLITFPILIPIWRKFDTLRSPAVRRWMPTGVIRKSSLAAFRPTSQKIYQAEETRSIQYVLHYNPSDEALAQVVREVMNSSGHHEAKVEASQHLVLITRHTDPAAVSALGTTLPMLTPIIAENVDFGAYHSIAHYQIVDFRSRNRAIVANLAMYFAGVDYQRIASSSTPLSLERAVLPSLMTRLENLQHDVPITRRLIPQSPESAFIAVMLLVLAMTLPSVLSPSQSSPRRATATSIPRPTTNVFEMMPTFQAAQQQLRFGSSTTGEVAGLQYELPPGWKTVETLDPALEQIAGDAGDDATIEWRAIYEDTLYGSQTRLLVLGYPHVEALDEVVFQQSLADTTPTLIDIDESNIRIHYYETVLQQLDSGEIGRGGLYAIEGGTHPLLFHFLVGSSAILLTEPPAEVRSVIESLALAKSD